jgi:DNA-binding transcriptional regulator LsrR (DeoR family)
MALVARRYYVDDIPKSDIAAEFGISRFKVARLIDDAKAEGIVKIRVEVPATLDPVRAEKLREAFGVRQVFVVESVEQFPGATNDLIARVAADYLMGAVGDEDFLGISWGSTVARVVEEIDTLPAIDVAQMVGGVWSADLDTDGSELVRRVSRVSQGQAYPLMAPLIVDSLATATALKGEASIVDVMGKYPRLSVALVGVGSWVPAQSSLLRLLSEADVHEATSLGAIADVCGIILDQAGVPVPSEVRARTLSITFDGLGAIPTVVAVSGGRGKGAATNAALRSGVVDVLVTDSQCAQEILDLL